MTFFICSFAPDYISFSSGTAAFGNPTMILEGNGSRVSFGSQDDHKNCVAGMLASALYLRNGADVNFNNGKTLAISTLTADAVPARRRWRSSTPPP